MHPLKPRERTSFNALSRLILHKTLGALLLCLLLMTFFLGAWGSEAQAQGAFSWRATDVGLGGGGKPRVLWTNSDGRMCLWTLGTTAAVEAVESEGPYPVGRRKA